MIQQGGWSVLLILPGLIHMTTFGGWAQLGHMVLWTHLCSSSEGSAWVGLVGEVVPKPLQDPSPSASFADVLLAAESHMFKSRVDGRGVQHQDRSHDLLRHSQNP